MQVISSKVRHPDSLGYNELTHIGSFSVPAIPASAANTAIQGRFPIPLNFKIVAVAVVVHGGAAGTVSFNIASGTGAEIGVGPSDTTPVGVVPSQTAGNGNTIFASDNAITMTNDLVQTFYPDNIDVIYPSNSQLTLRLATNGAAAGALDVTMYGTPFDNNTTNPEIGPFVPSLSVI